MTNLGDVLTADQVRNLHLQVFRDAKAAYLRSGPQGGQTSRDIEQRIRNVQDSKIRKNLREIANFDLGTLRQAWSHHMAVGAGTHLWPDANHRTALMSFTYAAAITYGVAFFPGPAAAREMTTRSKARRDADFLARGGRYYTREELRDPRHPYRALYAEYEALLEPMDAPALVRRLREQLQTDGE